MERPASDHHILNKAPGIQYFQFLTEILGYGGLNTLIRKWSLVEYCFE